MAGVRITAATREVLVALLRFELEKGAYGLQVVNATGLAGGTVYPILDRLDRAGILRHEWEAEVPAKEGRPARCFWRLTPTGVALALAEHRKAAERIAFQAPAWKPGPEAQEAT